MVNGPVPAVEGWKSEAGRKKTVLILASCVALLLVTNAAPAQEISATAATDKTQYLVGDYVNYAITVSCDKGCKIYPPVFIGDSLTNISLIEKAQPEEQEKDGKINVTFKYVLAGYDSAGVTIPATMVPYQAPGDSTTRFAYTNPVSFTVQTVKIDPRAEIKDVKPPIKIPFDWRTALLWTLVGLLALGVLYYFYKQYRKKKEKSRPAKETIILPSHVIALNALGELERQKLWQKGMVKEYHSTITEIIRRYFENRFDMPALELPTSEVIAGLRQNPESEPILGTTRAFLSNADLVKFAKFIPLNAVNEEMMKQAHEIVNKTVPAPVSPADSSGDSKQPAGTGNRQ